MIRIMNYLSLNLVLLIFTILCFYHALVVVDSSDEEGEQESEGMENSLLKKSMDDYNNGFQQILMFFASMNKTMTGMMDKIQNLEDTTNLKFKDIENLQTEFAEIKSEFKRTVTNSTAEISDMETTANNYSNFQISHEDLTAKLDKLQNVSLHTGKSFKGYTLSEIIYRVSDIGYKGRYTAVVFANYLDETINDFTIYDEYDAIFNPGPTSIPPHTEEVFTFYEQRISVIRTSFSYVIPSNGVRIAAILWAGALGAGLGFVSHGADMKTYFDSTKGINGSFVYKEGNYVDRNISVGYQNLHARLFARKDGVYKATVRIELIKLF